MRIGTSIATSRTRLDKFLAAPDRLGWRSRALAALERGKVFLNGTEVSAADAAMSGAYSLPSKHERPRQR